MQPVHRGCGKPDSIPWLVDEEERLYWEVSQERERNIPKPSAHALALISLAESRKRQQHKRQPHKRRGLATPVKANALEATQVNENGKRILDDDLDMQDQVKEKTKGGKNSRKIKAVKKGRLELGNQKRVKVDSVEALFSSMKVGLGDASAI